MSWVAATREEYIHESEMTRALQELPIRGAASTVPAGPARAGAIMSNNTTFTVNPRQRSRSRDQEPRDPSSSVRLNKFTGPNPHALPLQPVNRRMELITRFVRLQEDEYERWEADVHSGQEVIVTVRMLFWASGSSTWQQGSPEDAQIPVVPARHCDVGILF